MGSLCIAKIRFLTGTARWTPAVAAAMEPRRGHPVAAAASAWNAVFDGGSDGGSSDRSEERSCAGRERRRNVQLQRLLGSRPRRKVRLARIPGVCAVDFRMC